MPRTHSKQKISTLWYSFKGVWEEAAEVEEAPKDTVIKDKKVRIDVLIHKETDDYHCKTPPYPVKTLYFELVAPEVKDADGRKFSVEGSDIEICRKTLWGMLDKNFAVKWEQYYLIQVEVRPAWHADGVNVNYEYDTVQKGTAHDGTLVLRQYEHARGYVVSPWPGEFKDKQGKVLACIPATEENKANLEMFAERFRQIGNAMKKMLRPQHINDTLLALTRVPLLPFTEGKQSEPQTD